MKLIAALALVGVVLTGCNTVKGFGQDVSKAGDKVTDTADHTQHKM
ncbi:entericidin A/B family lipoprotein [Alkanindiges illinoisensis]|uniref:Entericidin A/B family lipoprotein n=1 Tax=Alkanindiges illinoisensis TaxID=197183 RepID=A0A4Y7XG06_9GAMM|nr:entericidin A/B family lipoprotein [Alkanindiges illinoisensis]TEU30803.1 entericidin A/B family lipoprotein [Alkanindiges illinoisensis]